MSGYKCTPLQLFYLTFLKKESQIKVLWLKLYLLKNIVAHILGVVEKLGVVQLSYLNRTPYILQFIILRKITSVIMCQLSIFNDLSRIYKQLKIYVYATLAAVGAKSVWEREQIKFHFSILVS